MSDPSHDPPGDGGPPRDDGAGGSPRATPPTAGAAETLAPHEVTAIELLWQSVWVRGIVYVVAAVLVLIVLVTQQQRYMFALQVGAIGFLIAYVLNPLVDLLQRLRIGRGLAVVLVYLLLLNLFVLGSVLLTQVVAETARFVALVPSAIEELTGLFGRLSVWFSGILDAAPDFLQERFGVDLSGDELAQQVQDQLAAWVTALAQALNRFLERLVAEGPSVLMAGATTIISTTFQVVLIAIGSAYILYDYHRLAANVRRYVPVRWRSVHADLSVKADRAVGGYLRGQIMITIILGFLIWIGLTLSGVPLALAISFLAAVFNLVPYLGPVVGTLPAVLLGLTVSPLTALLALIVFVVANQIEAHLLSPMILGKSTDIHPVTVLISILIGIGFLGILGAFIAVPIAAMVKVVLEEYVLTRPAYQEPDEVDEAPEGGGAAAPG
jgi:predicted PurR-regulated permease PerM